MKFRELKIQTRTTLHTITFQKVQRAEDSEYGYTEDDEHDRGFEFRWHREARHWLPDVGKEITRALWKQMWADEARLYPNESEFTRMFRKQQEFMVAAYRETIASMAATFTTPRGGITYIKPVPFAL